MTFDQIVRNRVEFDRARAAALAREKAELLGSLSPAHLAGLRVWYFGGPAALGRDPLEIPLAMIRKFVGRYTSVAA